MLRKLIVFVGGQSWFGGGGGINHLGTTDLVVIRGNWNAQGYINDVLRPVVVPFIHNQNGPVIVH